jgi:hypothetical protein
MKFSAEKINYQSRLKKEFLIGFLILAVLILSTHFRNPVSIVITFSGVLLAAIGFGVTAHFKARRYFYEVELTDKTIILKGDLMNRHFAIELPIAETNILVKTKSKGRGNAVFFIRFKLHSGNFDINRLDNWNYTTLLKLFYAFKEAKQEKIIWDEKYHLEHMEKRAEGM